MCYCLLFQIVQILQLIIYSMSFPTKFFLQFSTTYWNRTYVVSVKFVRGSKQLPTTPNCGKYNCVCAFKFILYFSQFIF